MTLRIWQVLGGPAGRPYADVFFKYGVALIGPGDAGPWSAGASKEDLDEAVRQVAEEIAPGDAVLLRTGSATILGVGRVAGEYQYLNVFDDVYGWDLQHARRVHWCPLPAPHRFEGAPFGAFAPRYSRVHQQDVVDFVVRFLQSPPTRWQTAPLPALPVEEPLLADVPAALADVVAQAADLSAMLQDPRALGDAPSEDERIVHLVVPLLRSLGWRAEQIAVQWRYVDVAVFEALPRIPANCRLLIEVKRVGAGVEKALDQARRYAEALQLRCDVVVTDGIRYRLYDGSRDFEPVAYAHLARLKRGATDLFARMQRR